MLRIRRAGKGLMIFCDFPCSALLGSISGALYHQGGKAAMVNNVARMVRIGLLLLVIPNQVHALQKEEVQLPTAGHATLPAHSQFTPAGW
jgi:hypothetical protein